MYEKNPYPECQLQLFPIYVNPERLQTVTISVDLIVFSPVPSDAGQSTLPQLCVPFARSFDPTLRPILYLGHPLSYKMPFGASHAPLAWLANSAICSFFRSIEVYGIENVPEDEPVIL
jgi:hypothetical protein